jgi:hypothetical protein
MPNKDFSKTDVENLINECNLSRKKLSQYERIFKELRHKIKMNRLWINNASVYINELEKKVKNDK